MNPESINIRLACLDDAIAIVAIYTPFVLTTAVSFEVEAPTVAEMRRRMAGDHQRLPWFVAESEDRVVGYAYASPYRARVAYQWTAEVSAYIGPDHHRLGIGRRLYAALFERLGRLGYRNTLAGITLPNAASVALHESFGFRPIGVFHHVGFKMGRWHDVGWWELPAFDGEDAPNTRPVSEDVPHDS